MIIKNADISIKLFVRYNIIVKHKKTEMKSRYKYGIFDLDGVLVNSIPTYTETFLEILNAKYKISDPGVAEYYQNSTGTPLEEQFEYVLRASNKPMDKISDLVGEFFDTVNRKDFVLFEGAKELLEKLIGRNIMLFLTTGSEDEMTKERLERAGILKYFALVLGSSKKEKGPWHIEKFARTAKVPADEFSSQAFYVGDGPFDMHLAKMFGIYAIGIPTTVSKNLLIESGADEVADNISKVAELDIFG